MERKQNIVAVKCCDDTAAWMEQRHRASKDGIVDNVNTIRLIIVKTKVKESKHE
jgi:hypothetical protein